jgi:Grx4 family monothiol glutaredoxin
MNDATRTQIETAVKTHKVVLFMKGNRRFPQCGFSATVAGILDRLLPGYETFNVLEDPALREGIKEYSQWPTIPQLYIDGEFIGGCDIVKALFASGELAARLGVSDAPRVKPLTAPELKSLRDRGEKLELFDVRTPAERQIASLPETRLLDEAARDYILGLPRDTRLVFHCHHGIRSQRAAEYFLQQGFTNVLNLEGGIDAWSQLVDPSVRRY